jgi:MFS family permease
MWTASVSSGLSFGCYTAFWTILVFLLMDRYGLGAVEAGLFGLLGLSGILAAPLAGKVTDRRGPSFTITTSLLAIIAGFALMGAVPLLAALITGAVLVDIGVQSIQVAAQTRVISLVPDAGSRLNTGYMVVRFAGGALGSFLGATVWPIWHWSGVCLLAICLAGVALVLHLAVARR